MLCYLFIPLQGAILSYDVTNRASFEALNAWAEEARRYGSQDMVVFVVGAWCFGLVCIGKDGLRD